MKHYYKRCFNFLLFISIGLNWAFAQNTDDESFSREHLEHDAIEKSYDIGIEIEQNVDTSLLIFLSKWLGVVYRYGGGSTDGTDCSGFVNN
jgi:cell wall-associated NlpC family hydrolase